MAVASILAAGVWFISPPVLIAGMRRLKGQKVICAFFYAQWALGALAAAGGAAMGRGWLNAAAFGASGLVGLILWWNSRRKRKRSLKLLGAKARARLAAMTRNMPRPSPRLVRVPA